ncbi:MAG: SusC/RagA family TonB-linked outer membrane protein [Bacteroidales bacterium]|nr:MAG: SusC/RagA family TonB-linked outer membrane protein [Bacteroidales bacterium]
MKKLFIIIAFLMLGCLNLVQAQTVRITGTVTSSEDGMPIPGVSVVVKGTTVGAATNIDGKYELNAGSDAQTLVFSFVGFKAQEVSIGGRSVIDVVLESETAELEELVVTGYAVRAKNSVTGSTIQVKADAIKDVSSASVDQALQGKVAGLVISSSSGTPGSVQDIRIRGAGSLTAGNDPLFVVDGVPVQNDDFAGSTAVTTLSALTSLNNNDIESVTVLKDASATSAYGARGSNGVIVITTKKGKAGKTNYSFSSFYGIQNKAVEGPKVLTGVQREALLIDAISNSYGVPKDQAIAYGNTNIANDFIQYNQWVTDGRPLNDWEKAYRNQNAPIKNFVFSASGGSNESSFYTSLAYNNTENIVLGSTFRKVNGTFNFTKKFTDKIKFSTNNSFSNVLQDGLMLEQSAYFGSPLAGKYFTSSFIAPKNADGTPNINTGNSYNWLYLKDHNVSFQDMNRGMTNSFLEIELIKNLKFKSLAALDYAVVEYKSHYNRNYGDSEGETGSTENSVEKNYNWVVQNSLAYNFIIGDHNISTMALVEYQKNRDKYLYGYGENFVTDGLTNVNSAGANKNADNTFNDWSNASYLGMINYSYLGKYIADFTYRREGSSKFPKTKRFGNFWSVGVAWNVTQEEFMKGIDVINNLKLRASYGVSGNSDIGLNKYQPAIKFNEDYAGQGAIYPDGYGNKDLTWEKNKNYDFGFDFAILSNKLSGSLSYFNKTTTDLLQAVPLSMTSGFTNLETNTNWGRAFYNSNVGSVVNKGIEAVINIQVVKTAKFNADLSLNFATLKNDVTKLAKDGLGNDIVIESGTRRTHVGHPINEWYMQKWAGVNPVNGNPVWFINGKDLTEGVTETYANAGKASQGTSPIPKYTGGASIHLDYMGIYFDASVYFAAGHQVFEDWSRYTNHDGVYSFRNYQGVATLMDRWQEFGDVTNVPRMVYSGNANFASLTSTRFLYDGDYMRLKDIVLGYKFDKALLTRIGFTGDAAIYVRGANLYTWVKDDRLKYDPEVRADGFTRLTNPPLKSITFGLNINF